MTTITPTAPRRMRGKLVRMLLTGLATTTLAGLLTANAALAVDVNRADLRDMDFTTQNVPNQWINVVSSNGTGWDKIEPGNVSFSAHVMINTVHHVFWHGVVIDVGIILGPCGEASCAGKPLLWSAHPVTNDHENQMQVTFPTSKIPVSSGTGVASVHHGDEIIAKCNQGTPGQERTFPYLMQATFVADTVQGVSVSNTSGQGGGTAAQWTNSADYSLTRMFQVQVRCKPYEPRVSGVAPPPPEPHRTKVTVTDIDLFLSTYAIPNGSQSGPNGTQCKPLKVTTRIATDKAGPKNVKLWRQVNGGPITSEEKRMEAEALGGGKFGDDWNKYEQFTQTTTVQYKAEVLGGTFAPETPWKSITIHCNGDFAPPQSNANPDNGNPPRKPKGEVQLPPTIVTPPPVCGSGKSAKRGSSAPCIKVAPLPDQRRQIAEQKRKEAAAQKRLAAKEAELRRREAALKSAADVRRQDEVRRPMHFGRFAPQGGAQRGLFRPRLMF